MREKLSQVVPAAREKESQVVPAERVATFLAAGEVMVFDIFLALFWRASVFVLAQTTLRDRKPSNQTNGWQ